MLSRVGAAGGVSGKGVELPLTLHRLPCGEYMVCEGGKVGRFLLACGGPSGGDRVEFQMFQGCLLMDRVWGVRERHRSQASPVSVV